MREVCAAVNVPVIASGGMGSVQHFLDVAMAADPAAVAIADVLHYGRIPLTEIRCAALAAGLGVRRVAPC